MRIGPPVLQEHGDRIRYSVPVGSRAGNTELWYSVDRAHADMLSMRADAALVALLIPAMQRGEDLHVEGIVSEQLYYNVTGAVQKILQIVIPSLWRIRIDADDVQPATGRAPGVAAGFSGGIDSYHVLAEHHYGNPLPGYRLTHLLYNNVGAHGKLSDTLFPAQYARLAAATAHLGLPFITVDSNLTDFYHGFTFQQTHSPRNLSVPLLLQNGIGRFFYASAFDFTATKVQQAHDLAYCDAVLIPLLGTEALDTLSVGSDVTRVEKTLRVATLEGSYRSLDICVSTQNTVLAGGDVAAANCSSCWKCRRSLLTLEIAGYLDRYAQVFDLAVYRRGREWYMAEVLNSDDPLLREIVAYATAQGFVFPWRARMAAALRLPELAATMREGQRLARRVVRRLRRRYSRQ